MALDINLKTNRMIKNIKLKNKLVLINALTKVFLAGLIIFIIPWWVSRISINETDDALINQLDQVLLLIDSLGIENYIDQDAELKSFGSYNILKDEYISIEELYTDSLIQYIDFTQRAIEGEIVDYRVLSYSINVGETNYLIEIGKSINTILQFEFKLKQFALIIAILILLISILIDLSFIQLLLKPFGNIVNKLKASTHPSNFNYNKIKTSTADFRYLDDTISNLMHKIEDAFNTEREYISNVSHELLTPISIIKSKLDNIIMEGKLSEEDMLKVFESKKTLGRLTTMVRTFLMMSRIENEEYLLSDKVNLSPIINDVVTELTDKVESKKLYLKNTLDTDLFLPKGNADLLFNVFYNFVNNAIRYTNQGGISINSVIKDQKSYIVIEDTGSGIDAKQLPFIFERFKQYSKEKDSFGLGLALSKKICDYHNIDIEVESEPDQGTSFKLLIPVN